MARRKPKSPAHPLRDMRVSSVRVPAVMLAFTGFDMAPQAGRGARGTMSWGVYLLTRNPRHGPRLLGDAEGPGLAQMVHVLTAGLHGSTVAGDGAGGANAVMLTKGEATDGALWSAEHLALWSQTVEVQAGFPFPADDALRTLASTWTFAGDATAATDLISLEGA